MLLACAVVLDPRFSAKNEIEYLKAMIYQAFPKVVIIYLRYSIDLQHNVKKTIRNTRRTNSENKIIREQ